MKCVTIAQVKCAGTPLCWKSLLLEYCFHHLRALSNTRPKMHSRTRLRSRRLVVTRFLSNFGLFAWVLISANRFSAVQCEHFTIFAISFRDFPCSYKTWMFTQFLGSSHLFSEFLKQQTATSSLLNFQTRTVQTYTSCHDETSIFYFFFFIY